jgi:hypothetical protein
VATDAVTSRELKSLHDELLAAQRERAAASAAPAAEPAPSSPSPPPDAAAEPPKDSGHEPDWHDQLHELTREAVKFLEETEKGIAAHPTQSVVGALLVGILIGRLLGRR